MKPYLETLNMDLDILADSPRTSLVVVEEAIGYPLTHRTEEVWDTSPGISKTAEIQGQFEDHLSIYTYRFLALRQQFYTANSLQCFF